MKCDLQVHLSNRVCCRRGRERLWEVMEGDGEFWFLHPDLEKLVRHFIDGGGEEGHMYTDRNTGTDIDKSRNLTMSGQGSYVHTGNELGRKDLKKRGMLQRLHF